MEIIKPTNPIDNISLPAELSFVNHFISSFSAPGIFWMIVPGHYRVTLNNSLINN
jgi:hypothetical protein